VSEEDLRLAWLRCLSTIEIFGQRPATESDYLFIWEAIRRALR
jgi:hypothetical protein